MATQGSADSGKAYQDAMAVMIATMAQHTMQAMSQAQEAVAEVLDTCAHNLTTSPPPEAVEQLLKPSEMIDRGFGVAEQLLKAQHALARTVVGAFEEHLVRAPQTASTAARPARDPQNDVADHAYSPDLETDPNTGAAEANSGTDDTGGLGRAIKNAFRGTAEQ